MTVCMEWCCGSGDYYLLAFISYPFILSSSSLASKSTSKRSAHKPASIENQSYVQKKINK